MEKLTCGLCTGRHALANCSEALRLISEADAGWSLMEPFDRLAPIDLTEISRLACRTRGYAPRGTLTA